MMYGTVALANFPSHLNFTEIVDFISTGSDSFAIPRNTLKKKIYTSQFSIQYTDGNENREVISYLLVVLFVLVYSTYTHTQF